MDVLKDCIITVRSGDFDIPDTICKYVSTNNGIIKCIDKHGKEVLIRPQGDGFIAFKVGDEEYKSGEEIGYPLDDAKFKKLYKRVEIKLEETEIKEYVEGYPIGIGIRNNKLCIVGVNEGGFNSVDIDIDDMIKWIDKNRDSIYKLKSFVDQSLEANQKKVKLKKKK